ncbi:hypothetical protein [Risungbinella massiliensis]|uniref:hypothetical protein n=1 Tax=Risungbinella massiliensis TaxID=1329796 RepID=UPI0005CC13DF|nr:hypothetical protein [Risungbinella massiliensis]
MMLQEWTQACDPKKLIELSVPSSLSDGLVPFLQTALDLIAAEKFMTLQETLNNQYKIKQTSYILAFNIFGFQDVDDSWLFFKPDREPIAYPDYIHLFHTSKSNQFYMHDHLFKKSLSPFSLNELLFEHYYAYHQVLLYQQEFQQKMDSLINWKQSIHNKTKSSLLEEVNFINGILFPLANMMEAHTKQWSLFSRIPRNSRGFYIPFKFIAIPETVPKKYTNRSNLLQTSYLTYEAIIHQQTAAYLSTHLKVAQTEPNNIMILTNETAGTPYTLDKVQKISQILESQQKKLSILQEELIDLGLR